MRNILKWVPLLAAVLSAQAADEPLIVAKPHLAVWLESSLRRVYPASPAGSTNLELLVARNGRASFQVCIQNRQAAVIHLQCAVEAIEGAQTQVRWVGLVPLPHYSPGTAREELDGQGLLPGLTPDPLYPETNAAVGPWESRSFRVTLNIASNATPGIHELIAHIAWDNGKHSAELPVRLEISPFIIQPRHDFSVIHWWRGESTWDYYKTGMFDDRWYDLTRRQLKDMLEHGSDVVYVPVLFDRRETFKHPCQLLIVNETQPGKYKFDWTAVKKFTDMCKAIGFNKFEWSHLWIYWGVQNPMRVYKKAGDEYVMLWPPGISGFSDTYVNFLQQFLPALHDFLLKEDMLDKSYFHLSDEPGGDAVERYRHARHILRDIAPWMKVMDALSDIRYGKEGITDMPIPIDSSAQAYIDAKIPHWVYFCCSPTGPWLNRFLDTPLPKVRMAGWLFYRLGAKGFLHWGFNYWDKMESEVAGDPFHDASNGAWPGIPYGDPFMIYPGPKDPIDSIRWEVFAESLQDYAILQTAGIQPGAPMLADLKTYADFPKSEVWINQALAQILRKPKD